MRILTLLAIAGFSGSFSSPPKEIKLQYLFKRGDVFELSQTTSQKIKQTIVGINQNTEAMASGVTRFKVLEIVPSGAKFEIEYLKMSMNLRLPMTELIMDSQGDSSQAATKVIRAMMGKKFNFTLSADGAVSAIENIDNLWSGMLAIKGVTDVQLKQIRQSLEQSFGKNSFKGSLEQALPYYPENKVRSGSSWKNKVGVGMSFPIEVENTWTLQSFTEDQALIGSEGRVNTFDSTKIIPLPGGVKATFNLQGRQVTKNRINRATGWPQEGKTHSEIKGKMTLQPGGMIPTNVSVPMEILAESSFVFVKK
jgi:hypothetical protein